MVLLFPLILGVATFIRCVSGGPAFFTQQRLGLAGKPFHIWKFRTMRVGAVDESHRDYVKTLAADSPAAKPEYVSRLIPGGASLRRWSLDELPQLWNVLRGEMSLVGPRPDVLCLEDYVNEFELRRFAVLPGMTGLWQVSGKNKLSFNQMIALDIRYVEEMSLLMDIWILFRTASVLVREANS